MTGILLFFSVIVIVIVTIYLLNNNSKKTLDSESIYEHFDRLIEFDNINSIKNNHQVLEYINRNTIYELKSKSGLDKNNDRIKSYLNHILEFSDVDKQILTKHINNINDNGILDRNNLTSVIKDGKFNTCKKWNLIKIKNTLEFGYPYTLGKFIFIPERFINDDSALTKILIHEKLHIIQRHNKKYYESLYGKLYGKYIFRINPDNIDISDIEHIWINNPDSNNELYLIKHQNNLYIVPYINKKTYVDTNYAYKVIEINNLSSYKFKVLTEKVSKNLLDFNILFSNNTSINFTHPNETYVDQFISELF